MTKDQIKERLTELDIAFEEGMKKEELEALLPVEVEAEDVPEPESGVVTITLKSALKHDGKRYEVGETLTVSRTQAKIFSELGVV